MKAPAWANNRTAAYVGLGLVAAIAVYYLIKKGAGALANVNAGTPYQGAGVVGTLGNVSDQLSGGTLSGAGSSIGGWFFDLTHPASAAGQVFHTVTFPDGTRHAIDAASVDANGIFSYAGAPYYLQTDMSGAYQAVPAGPVAQQPAADAVLTGLGVLLP